MVDDVASSAPREKKRSKKAKGERKEKREPREKREKGEKRETQDTKPSKRAAKPKRGQEELDSIQVPEHGVMLDEQRFDKKHQSQLEPAPQPHRLSKHGVNATSEKQSIAAALPVEVCEGMA